MLITVLEMKSCLILVKLKLIKLIKHPLHSRIKLIPNLLRGWRKARWISFRALQFKISWILSLLTDNSSTASIFQEVSCKWPKEEIACSLVLQDLRDLTNQQQHLALQGLNLMLQNSNLPIIAAHFNPPPYRSPLQAKWQGDSFAPLKRIQGAFPSSTTSKAKLLN